VEKGWSLQNSKLRTAVRRPKKLLIAVLMIVLISVAALVGILVLFAHPKPKPIGTSNLSYSKALDFYLSLNTSTGLLREYSGATTIYLSDDQALDYYALRYVYSKTGNISSVELANQINSSSIRNFGGMLQYWNPTFEIFGDYPNNSTVQSGNDVFIRTDEGYNISVTEFSPDRSFNYSQYADQLALRVLLNLHFDNNTGAESSFRTLNSMWNGNGLNDSAFQKGGEAGIYQSYKLALYIIAWKALEDNSATASFVTQYDGIAGNVTLIMSELQSPNTGGVWTGYKFSSENIVFGPGVSLQNGETTSLFVLAGSV
jgi:hypothetical protein